MALLRKVSIDMVNVKLRQSPAYSSESQGVVERYHQTLQGQIRTFCVQLKERVNLDIDSSSALLPWIVKHSAWTLSRFLVHSSDKLTSYARRWGQSYGSPICSFGESVYFKVSASRHAKLKSSWSHGVWVGKESSTNDYLVGTAGGEIIRVRTVRRMPLSSQWQLGPLRDIKGTPSSPRGDGELGDKFVLSHESL